MRRYFQILSRKGGILQLVCVVLCTHLRVGLVVQPLYISGIADILSKDSVSSNDSECNTKIAFLVLGTFLTSASFFIVSAISFDRFLAFTLHLCYREILTDRKVTITISVLRTLSVVTSVGYLLIGDMNREVVSIAFTTAEFFCRLMANGQQY